MRTRLRLRGESLGAGMPLVVIIKCPPRRRDPGCAFVSPSLHSYESLLSRETLNNRLAFLFLLLLSCLVGRAGVVRWFHFFFYICFSGAMVASKPGWLPEKAFHCETVLTALVEPRINVATFLFFFSRANFVGHVLGPVRK